MPLNQAQRVAFRLWVRCRSRTARPMAGPIAFGWSTGTIAWPHTRTPAQWLNEEKYRFSVNSSPRLGQTECQPVATSSHEYVDDGNRYSALSPGIGCSRYVQIGKGNKMPKHYRVQMPPGYKVPDWKYLPHWSMGIPCRPGHPRARRTALAARATPGCQQDGFPYALNEGWRMQLEYEQAVAWCQLVGCPEL